MTARGLRRRRRLRSGRWLYDAVGLVVFAIMIFPIYWMVATAFKPGRDILRFDPKWIPAPATLANFQDAVTRPNFWNSVRASLTVVLVVVAVSLVLAFLAAVGVARFGFRGRRAFVVMILVVQMVPLTALVIPIYLLANSLNVTDTLLAVIVTYLAVILPFMVWTLRGFVANIPVELEESAMIDGCTRLGAFWRIVFPLTAPGLVATAVYAFIQAWNEYIVAYVLLSDPTHQTLTVWLASFTTNHGTDWGPLMAGATLTSIPVVLFFLLLQRHVTSGLTVGAVKG
ncbi:MAG TPA: carbohydrate ABC transporter permease [Candidatus Dormibacteraeota bacterium]|nr:carbohydrate ABC transporter permease [Candidatus Dormibacteraeota bacterium]